MHPIRLVQSVTWFIVLSTLAPAIARQKSSFPAPDDLVLEMALHGGPPSHYHVPSVGVNWMETFEFKRLDSWRRPPTQTSDIGAIHIDYYRRGDAVVIDVDVIFGQIDLSSSQPVDAARIKSGGSYVIRAGESGSLQELAGFGIEPIKVKVVYAESHPLNPADIATKAKAIEVVRVDQSRELFRIVLKNISSKRVVIGKVECVGVTMNFGPLAPGQIQEVPLEVNAAYLRPPQGKSQNEPAMPKVVVTSIVFEDLTFEGDLEPALFYIAQRRGEKIQQTRIVGLLEAAIENPEQDSAKALETLRQQLSALIEAPDIQVLNDLAERFGPFTQYQRNRFLVALKDGLSDTKHGMLTRTQFYEKKEAPKGTSLQSWLRTVRSLYEEMIKKS